MIDRREVQNKYYRVGPLLSFYPMHSPKKDPSNSLKNQFFYNSTWTLYYIYSQEYIKLRIKDFVINSKEGDADNQDSDDDADDFYH